MLEKKVLETIRKHNLIEKGDKIIVGVSGGPDSVCLLHILRLLSDVLGIDLYAIHINHMLREYEADKDEEYVGMLCDKIRIPLFIKHIDVKNLAKQEGLSIEEAGREARYREFNSIAQEIGANRIAVAHNRNDQAETVIMNIIRGTGLNGLKGMDYKRDRIIRPLLDIGRDEIEKYCVRYELNPRTDSSNLESMYTRNKIRLELFPVIERLFKSDIIGSICRMSELVREDSDLIESIASKVYNECVLKNYNNRLELNIPCIIANHSAISKRVIRMAINEIKGDLKGIQHIHIKDILEMLESGKTGKEIHIPGGLQVKVSYDVLQLSLKDNSQIREDFNVPVNIPGVTEVAAHGFVVEASLEEKTGETGRYLSFPQNAWEQYFDYDKLHMGINIRSRKNGDIFKPFKSTGTKKLKEYFIDNKIPRDIRDDIPLVSKGNEIVWIIGYRTSDKFKVTENTKSVLKLTYRKLNQHNGLN